MDEWIQEVQNESGRGFSEERWRRPNFSAQGPKRQAPGPEDTVTISGQGSSSS